MTQNGSKLSKNYPKWPKITPKWPKNDARIYPLFPQFFLTEKAVPQTFSLLECMGQGPPLCVRHGAWAENCLRGPQQGRRGLDGEKHARGLAQQTDQGNFPAKDPLAQNAQVCGFGAVCKEE